MILNFTSYRSSKSNLWNDVRPMSRREFNNLINPIISRFRKISIEDAKKKRFLQSKEVICFYLKIGEGLYDKGKTLEINTKKVDKYYLKENLPFVSVKEFKNLIPQIISENRKISLQEAKYKRYIFPTEVFILLKELGEVLNEDELNQIEY